MLETQFDNARLAHLGIECMTLSELRRRVSSDRLLLPERLDFYMLLLVLKGQGSHSVDFVRGQLRVGSLVFVRPGQVQQWGDNESLDGPLLLITAPALLTESRPASSVELMRLAIDEWPSISYLPKTVLQEIALAVQRLEQDFERFDDSALDAALIRHDVSGLLMRLGRCFSAQDLGDSSGSVDRAIYRLLILELEASYRNRLGVNDYAARLGYSASTLSRACLSAEGRTAKQVIDRRVALEAARLLVHTSLSVVEIGHHLGFSEPTNFVKFFVRLNQRTPQVFRQKHGPPH